MNNSLVSLSPGAASTDVHRRNLDGLARNWRWAVMVLLACGAVMLLWATFAPLSRAAIAPGEVAVDGRRREVENLEGGIIAAVLVREGQTVVEGQPLIRFDSIQSSAAADAVEAQRLALLAERQRLLDEGRGGALSDLPSALANARGEPRTKALLEAQRELLSARRQSLSTQHAVLRQSASQAQARLAGYAAQISSTQQQLDGLRSEEQVVGSLVAEQLERNSRLQEVRRQIAAAEGQIGALRAQMNATQREAGEAYARISDLSAQRVNERAARLAEIHSELSDIEERSTAAQDVDRRRIVTAPVSGRIVELRYMTKGAVAAPGDRLLDIVPQNQEMIVVARVRPIDIESVRPGLSSEVRLVPFSTRRVRMLRGVVESVSPDTITNRDQTETYYEARIRIDDPKGLAPIADEITSGMPVEVFIELEKRSFLESLLQPLTDSFRRALRE